MRCVIVSGGSIQENFFRDFLCDNEWDRIIVADKGMEICRKCNVPVNMIVGDFDSVSGDTLEFYKNQGVEIKKLRPEKDDSDTQSAFHWAVDCGAREIVLLGGTGTRLDHVYANIQLLAIALDMGIEMSMVDAYNYITVKREGFTIVRDKQFGDFVSFFSLGDCVADLTLKGFKYPLTNHQLKNTDSGLSVSNEIIENRAQVSFSSGTLVMIQSRDYLERR